MYPGFQRRGAVVSSDDKKLGQEGFDILRKLENWGVEFPRDKNGKYNVKGDYFYEMAGELKLILNKEVLDRGVKVIEWFMATSLSPAISE